MHSREGENTLGTAEAVPEEPDPHVVHRDPLSLLCLSSLITLEAAKPSAYHDRTRGGFHGGIYLLF